MTWMASLRDTFHLWGSTAEERQRHYPCDEVIPEPGQALFRAVSVRAPAATVFRWLCQMRVAPYSYDWIDNLGRRSPQELTPGVERLEVGQPVMVIFDLVSFETDRHLTLEMRQPRIFPPIALTYAVTPVDESGCRLVVKLISRLGPGLRDRMSKVLLPPLDWIMMRRQLLNLKGLAERDTDSDRAASPAAP